MRMIVLDLHRLLIALQDVTDGCHGQRRVSREDLGSLVEHQGFGQGQGVSYVNRVEEVERRLINGDVGMYLEFTEGSSLGELKVPIKIHGLGLAEAKGHQTHRSIPIIKTD